MAFPLVVMAAGKRAEMEEQAVVAQGPDGLSLDSAKFGPRRIPYGTQTIEWE